MLCPTGGNKYKVLQDQTRNVLDGRKAIFAEKLKGSNKEVAKFTDKEEEDLVRLYLTDIGQYPLLTKEDEVKLAKAIEEGAKAREELGESKRTEIQEDDESDEEEDTEAQIIAKAKAKKEKEELVKKLAKISPAEIGRAHV